MKKQLAALVLASGLSLLTGCATLPKTPQVGLDEIAGMFSKGNEIGIPIVNSKDKKLEEIGIYEAYFDSKGYLHLLYEGYVTTDGKFHQDPNYKPVKYLPNIKGL